MPTIAYDQPVANFIAGLNATGHVTHTQHRKKSVTLHHNGGRLSLQGILDVWKVRPASAHFQVDGGGHVGQYVKVNEYAWATGTTRGNQESISIEMANSSTGGNWPVASVTWHNAARLAAWLHWKVLGVKPTRTTLKMHHDWKSTTCAGPYIDKVYPQILQLSRWWYDQLRAGKTVPKPPASKPGKKGSFDMTTRLVCGDSKQEVPGKGYTYGDFQFLVRFAPELPGGAVRRYMPSGAIQELLAKAQGGVDVMPQAELDKILYAEGGRPPTNLLH